MAGDREADAVFRVAGQPLGEFRGQIRLAGREGAEPGHTVCLSGATSGFHCELEVTRVGRRGRARR
ncbi:hypothetical protein ACFVXG_33610 [Kitasatospora sp. NPDC058162]|uniref:hypothetical protein n=1 Tax=Kitasatospora sp. NPDC058162 TaxID=3346362 RepID=UPI0036D7784E